MLLGHRLAYDTDTMVGCTARDKMVIDKVLETNKYLEIAVYNDALRVVDCNCYITSVTYITYDPKTMRGRAKDDEAAIDGVLNAERKLHIRNDGDELRLINVICYVATAVYKDKDDSKRSPSL